MRRFLGLAALLASTSVANAQSAPKIDPLGTRPGLEIGAQMSHYNYLEPEFAEISGNRLGVVGAWTLTGTGGWFSKIDLRGSYGLLDYQGSGTMVGVPDSILEGRAVAGLDWMGANASLSGYLGLGYRYLFDDLRGYSSTGAAGYRRYSNYLYAPIGLTARLPLWGLILAPTLEADVFLRGWQVSKLSDAGIPGLTDVTNTQHSGRGHRVSFMIEKDHVSFGVWSHYWHIGKSDVQPLVGGAFGAEPENYTREYGGEFRYRF